MNLLRNIFIILLLLFPLGEVLRIDLGSGIVLKPIDIGVGIASLFWVILKILDKEKIKHINIFIPIMIFSSFALLSLAINSFNLTLNELFISLLYLIRWIAYAVIFFVFCDFNKDFKSKLSRLLTIVGSAIVLFGYLQYFFYQSLKNLFYLGWDEHMYRMFSVFFDPNFAGAFFVLFFLFLIFIYLKERKILIGLLSFLTLGAVFLTFSRSALIMLVVSSSLLFILMNKKIWIVALLGITTVVLLVSSRYFNIENINLFRIVSSEARVETAKNAILIMEKNPLIGVGFNAYRYAQFRYGLRSENAQAISHADAGTDNSFLFILATTGIIGFILYLFLWLRILKSVSALAIGSIVGVFVNSMFINSLFYPFIMLWIWMILALSMKNHN